MTKVALIWTGWILLDQRHVTVWVGNSQPAELCEHYCLNNSKTLLGPVSQVLRSFLAIETVKELPCCVAEIEKWFASLVLEITPIFSDLQTSSSPWSRDLSAFAAGLSFLTDKRAICTC